MDRIEKIRKFSEKERLSIEIAPYFAPALKKSEGFKVLTLDVFDTATLIKLATNDPNIPKANLSFIEPVDIVSDACEIQKEIENRKLQGKINSIVSSHNFEHLPNPIKFLQGCLVALKEGGHLSMAIPDYRACFDHYRFPTRLSEWLIAYESDLKSPSAASILDSRLNASFYQASDSSVAVGCDINAGDPLKFNPNGYIGDLYPQFLKSVKFQEVYEDTHVSVLFPKLLELHLIDLIHIGLLNFQIIEISETVGLEFFVHLKKIDRIDYKDSREEYLSKRKALLIEINRELGSSIFSTHHQGQSEVVARPMPEKIYLYNRLKRLKNKVLFRFLKHKIPLDFLPDVYCAINPDVSSSYLSPAQHYVIYGLKEKRDYKKLQQSESLEKQLARYTKVAPEDINSFDLFSGSWSTSFPGFTNAPFAGTEDPRIDWLMKQVNVKNLNILELGPLEGAHTLMLERAGATVTAIEANVGAFQRCLVVKNQFNLVSKFILGDFEKYNFDKNYCDLIVASGVLYHLKDPVSFLGTISSASNRLFIWTHYFESDLSKWNPSLKPILNSGKWAYKTPIVKKYDDLEIRMVKQLYGEDLGWSGFCGGSDVYSHWIFKEDLLKLLSHFGFSKIVTAFDDVKHPNGPAFCVYLEK